jgi:outer membrane receptor protein involved in Fe transport
MLLRRALAGLCLAVVLIRPASAQESERLTVPERQITPARLIAFDISARPLAAALNDFARQADISIGHSALSFGDRRSQDLIGYYTLEDGLARLLEATGFTYRALDPQTIRIVRRLASPALSPKVAAGAVVRRPQIEEITVTTTKRAGEIQSLPYSIAAATGVQLEALGAQGSNDVALRIAGITVTNLGLGRNKVILRGLSDGPFTGRTQSTVGLYLDDVRITYNLPDPGIRLFDVERVEVLRGPQGTLYGAGSLGGIYRIVTNKPALDGVAASVFTSMASTRGGGLSHEGRAMLNIPVIKGVLGLRAVGYVQREAGYIDDIRLGLNNVNKATVRGGRFGALWRLSDVWSVTGAAMIQTIAADDTQYYDAALGTLKRANFLREPYHNNFLQASITANGNFSWADLVSSTAYIRHRIHNIFDATLAVPVITGLPAVTSPFSEDRYVKAFVHETRLVLADGGRFDWLVGGFASHREEVFDANLNVPGSGVALGLGQSDVVFFEFRDSIVNEAALFGEATWFLTDRLSITGGARWFYTKNKLSSLKGTNIGEIQALADGSTGKTGVTPKVVLGFQANRDILIYGQLSEGYRVGGINLSAPAARGDGGGDDEDNAISFPSDTLLNFELGVKSRFFDRRLIINAAAYYILWNKIQSDQLRPDGFRFVLTAGDARITGLELDIRFRQSRRLTVRGNLSWNTSELTKINPALGTKVDNRLPSVPLFSAGLAMQYTMRLADGFDGSLSADYAYVGASSLLFDRNNSPRMGGYSLANVRFGVQHGPWRATVFVENVGNAEADSFSFGNPFSLHTIRQVTPLRPRTIGVSLGWRY